MKALIYSKENINNAKEDLEYFSNLLKPMFKIVLTKDCDCYRLDFFSSITDKKILGDTIKTIEKRLK